MQDIDVFVINGAIQVPQSLTGLHSGDSVAWGFHSTDTQVQWAEIEFSNPAYKFFADRGGAKVSKRLMKLESGHGNIVGTAPELGEHGSRPAKYTVRVRATQHGPALHELDPVIVICDP